MRRAGFGLAELVVALTLLAVVMATLGRVLIGTQRLARTNAQRVGLRQGLRAAASVLPAELRELDAADSDIVAMTISSITVRGMRQIAFLCTMDEPGGGAGLSLVVRRAPFFGSPQSFSAGDSVLIYADGDPATRTDDAWIAGLVTVAADEACPDPDQARPGERLMLRLRGPADTSTETRRGVSSGAPVRSFVVVSYAPYRSGTDGQWYLGQQQAGSPTQPLAGPLTGADGLSLSYYDTLGIPTADRTAVAGIEIRVRGRTTVPVRSVSGAMVYQTDSVVTRVALRNNPRCGRCQ